MSIDTNVDIKGDYYGVWYTSSKGDYFSQKGKKVCLEEVYQSIEDDTVFLKLSCDYFDKTKIAYILHGDLFDQKLGKELSNLGFDITKNTFDCFVDSIRLQEEEFENNHVMPSASYSSLGWIYIPVTDPKSGCENLILCYRCSHLIGYNDKAKYIGNYNISPYGQYSAWKEMVISDVVPYPALQFVLIAALSSVIVGILALKIPMENPIVHLNLPSSKGKSTAAYLASSIIGKPFDGTEMSVDEDGKIIELQSVYQSWGSTDNAMIATQAGNRGVVTVLNELGKSLTKNMAQIIFNLSEGSDKKRSTIDLKARITKGFSTTFISTGESSLLDKCQTKQGGLAVRIMEITNPLTVDAAHSNRIKNTCVNNCGYAAPRLANYIIKNGGADSVTKIYNNYVAYLQTKIKCTPNAERFVEKFAALFMTTVVIASKALKINFDTKSLLDFLIEYDSENGSKRNSEMNSYNLILEYCTINFNISSFETIKLILQIYIHQIFYQPLLISAGDA